MNWIHNGFQHNIQLELTSNTVFVTQTKRISLFHLWTKQTCFLPGLKTECILAKKNTCNFCTKPKLFFYLISIPTTIPTWWSSSRYRSRQGFFLWVYTHKIFFFCGYVDLRKKCSSGKLSKFHLKNMIFINEIVKRRARKQKISPAAR